MRHRRTNLREYGQIIEKIPEHLAIKRELQDVHRELNKTLKESKQEHANRDYYQPKLNQLFGILRRTL